MDDFVSSLPTTVFLGASIQWPKKPGALSCVSSPSAGKGHWPFLGSVNLEEHRAIVCQEPTSCFVCLKGEIKKSE